MLQSWYNHIDDSKDDILAKIDHGINYEKLVQKARDTWIDYSPIKEQVSMVGIDSSYNRKKYQGFDLIFVGAVAIDNRDTIQDNTPFFVDVMNRYDYKTKNNTIKYNEYIAIKSNRMEIDLCKSVIDKFNLVLMDGTPYAMFIRDTIKPDELRLLREKGNVLFISKTSDMISYEFKKNGSRIGDIYYYNHISNKPGFSKLQLQEDKRFREMKKTYSTFIRLGHSTPIIKLEFLSSDKNDINDDTVKDVMNKLVTNSVNGYPEVLTQAHENCKIHTKDAMNMSEMLGLYMENSSRVVLDE